MNSVPSRILYRICFKTILLLSGKAGKGVYEQFDKIYKNILKPMEIYT